jgi:hypothetical protein
VKLAPSKARKPFVVQVRFGFGHNARNEFPNSPLISAQANGNFVVVLPFYSFLALQPRPLAVKTVVAEAATSAVRELSCESAPTACFDVRDFSGLYTASQWANFKRFSAISAFHAWNLLVSAAYGALKGVDGREGCWPRPIFTRFATHGITERSNFALNVRARRTSAFRYFFRFYARANALGELLVAYRKAESLFVPKET